MFVQQKFDQQNVRKYHYFLLLGLIQKHKQISRSQLADMTAMSNTTVGKIVKELLQDGFIHEVGHVEGDVGRRATLLELNPYGALIVGVEIDLTSVQIAIVTLDGLVMDKIQFAFDIKGRPNVILDKVADGIMILLQQLTPDNREKVIAIGVSMPGLVSWPEGKVSMVPQFRWNDVQVKSYLEEKLPLQVYVDNHVRSILLAERLFGTLNTTRHAVCMYVGSGVGGAVMTNGDIVRGVGNTLGEIGHLTMDPNGPLCDCGRLGCLQTFISISELEKQAQMPVAQIFAAYERGETWSLKLLDRAKQYLGIAIANIICMYNPQVVLLAGPMIEDYPSLTHDIKAITDRYIWTPLEKSFVLAHATFGKASGVVGASAIVLNEFLTQAMNDQKDTTRV